MFQLELDMHFAYIVWYPGALVKYPYVMACKNPPSNDSMGTTNL
jgi:hypothetical protein